jgi:hypothetical protein
VVRKRPVPLIIHREEPHALQPVGAMFSQEYSKAAVPDICSLPTQANRERQIVGVSFALNNTATKVARAFNARRNRRFSKKL